MTIVLDIVEIILIAKKQMPPALYLASACLKSFIWLIIFILNLISLSVLAIILTAILAYVTPPTTYYHTPHHHDHYRPSPHISPHKILPC